jgi:hypothetical protein
LAATDRDDEFSARRNGSLQIGGDNRRSLASDGVVIRINFNLHATNLSPTILSLLPWRPQKSRTATTRPDA